jgi:protein dithiol oxidoreductase (disulfide-forming)
MKRVLVILLALAATASAALYAQSRPTAGTEYRMVNPAQPVSGTKIEVVEFFNYACPHCYDFEPLLKTWLATKPADVEFRYVPAVFNQRMLPLARVYYTLEEMGLLDKLHMKVYAAIHEQGLRLDEKAVLMRWVAEQGVDADKFHAVFDSFSVGTKAQRATQMTRNYRVPGTPYVVVNGKYLTGPSMTLRADGGVDAKRFVQVLNGLIDMARRG